MKTIKAKQTKRTFELFKLTTDDSTIVIPFPSVNTEQSFLCLDSLKINILIINSNWNKIPSKKARVYKELNSL